MYLLNMINPELSNTQHLRWSHVSLEPGAVLTRDFRSGEVFEYIQ